MAIAIEVAKVSGAVRCKRWGKDLGGDPPAASKRKRISTIGEMIVDSRAYVRREKKKIEKRLRS